MSRILQLPQFFSVFISPSSTSVVYWDCRSVSTLSVFYFVWQGIFLLYKNVINMLLIIESALWTFIYISSLNKQHGKQNGFLRKWIQQWLPLNDYLFLLFFNLRYRVAFCWNFTWSLCFFTNSEHFGEATILILKKYRPFMNPK